MEVEATHEIDVTPDKLREIAVEMERKSKNENFQAGQVVRYKFSSRFAFVFKPDKTISILKLDESEVDNEGPV